MSITLNKALPDLSKLEPLDGSNYKRWSQKLLIFFEALEVDYILFSDIPSAEPENPDTPITPVSSSPSDSTTKTNIDTRKKYFNDNKTVRGHLLNHMTNSLFNIFVKQKYAKDIWDTLEKRYGADNVGKKKYVVSKWLQFQMGDDKPMMDQIHEYENLVTDVIDKGMKMCEIQQANVLLEEFPPSWSDYKNQLKYKKKDLSLQELISHMRIEEANQQKDKQNYVSSLSVKANLVEYAGASNDRFKGKKNKKDDQQKKQKQFKKNDNKIQKKKVTCYVCGKTGHKAYQCYQRKNQQNSEKKQSPQANLTETEEIIAAVVVEANLAENKTDWILDIGASKHLSKQKSVEKLYK